MEHFGTVSIVNIFNRQFNRKLPTQNCQLYLGVPLRVRLYAHTAQALSAGRYPNVVKLRII